MTVQLDQPVADFTAQATSAKTLRLSALKGQNVVLYFYPKDSTPGCTTEGQDFRDLYAAFTAANTVILGVSACSLKSHENFKAKQSFPFELISDEDKALCEQFGVYQLKKNYGKEYMGIVRSTFLIDAQGVLRSEWRNVRVKEHAAKVLEAVQALQNP